MSVRSLPHFSHKPIGKTTHKKGMSYSHVNYITREEACSKTLAQNMPADRDGARPFFERQAYKDGVPANARIADTLIIALPIETDQRSTLRSGRRLHGQDRARTDRLACGLSRQRQGRAQSALPSHLPRRRYRDRPQGGRHHDQRQGRAGGRRSMAGGCHRA